MFHDKYNFCHLHNHTQFSMLQSTIKITDLVDLTYKNNMNAVAITDLGNMMGAFRFISEVKKVNQKIDEENKSLDEQKHHIKPIIGCVLNVCEDRLNKNYRDNGYQMVFLAKNKKGYDNLSKLSSLGYTEGFYYVPRVDKELILEYKSDLIVLSGNLSGEISNKILKVGKAEAEQSLIWWRKNFKDDFYLEINRHNQKDENAVNEVLLNLSNQYNINFLRHYLKIYNILLLYLMQF